MPSANVANVTVSAPRRKQTFVTAACGLIVLAIFAFSLLTLHQKNTCRLALESTCLRLEFANTPAQQERGLGGRDSMPYKQGMLFVLDGNNDACFWMKDMRFPLDIVWLNSNKQVVKIEAGLKPDTYPQSYCPDQQANYVLEVNSGLAAQNHIKIGAQLNF